MFQGGQFDAGLVAAVELGPLAIAADMEGLPRVTKLAQMVMKALAKAGPWFGVGVPPNANPSEPCSAPMTEYWYL